MVPASELPVMAVGQLQVIHSYISFSNGLECAWEIMEASGSLLGIFIALGFVSSFSAAAQQLIVCTYLHL